MTNLNYWIALTEVSDIGPVTAKKLLAVYSKPEAIFNASCRELSSIISAKKAKNIKEFDGWKSIENRIKKIESRQIRVVTFKDRDYPEYLRNIEDAPVIFYAKGSLCKEDRFAIGVVGSRKPTSYGTFAAEKLSSELSAMGFTIVSGMARGLDTVAHTAAINAGGRSIAVLGSGIDIPYPAENKSLIEKVSRSGCVISEFPPGAPPDKENFPRRNRLISGLSLGVLVIEATIDSGSLITANCAAEQNKEVFAVPGNINSLNSEGTNRLIKSGAKLVQKVEDIVEELVPVLKGFIKAKDMSKLDLAVDEQRLCDIMTAEPKHVDIISRESGMPASKVLGILLSLELKGVAKQAEGKKFYLV